MVARTHQLITITVSISLVIDATIKVVHTCLHLGLRYMLNRAILAEVVGSTGLTTAMPLTLYNLSTELGSHLLLLVHGLVV